MNSGLVNPPAISSIEDALRLLAALSDPATAAGTLENIRSAITELNLAKAANAKILAEVTVLQTAQVDKEIELKAREDALAAAVVDHNAASAKFNEETQAILVQETARDEALTQREEAVSKHEAEVLALVDAVSKRESVVAEGEARIAVKEAELDAAKARLQAALGS